MDELNNKKQELQNSAGELHKKVKTIVLDIEKHQTNARQDQKNAFQFHPERQQYYHFQNLANDENAKATQKNDSLPKLKDKSRITSMQARICPKMIAFLSQVTSKYPDRNNVQALRIIKIMPFNPYHQKYTPNVLKR